jgi:hypothetical protein
VARRPLVRRVSGLPLLGAIVSLIVVLVLVDLLAGLILLARNLFVFRRRQLAAVGAAIGGDFVVDVGFAMLHVGGLARSELPGTDPWAMRPCWL